MKFVSTGRFPALRLGLLTLAALAIHGYHLGVEDGEIYIPSVRKLLNPALYPYAAQFFLSHARMSLFAPIVAASARLAHLSADWSVFLWYIVTTFATIAACWSLAEICFLTPRARWSAVVLITTALTMPASNTGLPLIDPHLTARSLSTPLTLFVLAALLRRRYLLACLLTVITAAIHPQMAAYLVFLAVVLWLIERAESGSGSRRRKEERKQVEVAVAGGAFALPLSLQLGPAPEPYREALYSRDFFFLSTWTWYHWLGLLAPLAFLLWFGRSRLRSTTPEFRRLSLALIPFGLVSIAAGAFTLSHQFDMAARLQPLRCFHLITFVFVLLLFGIMGEYLARGRAWVIPALALPLAAGMCMAERSTYPCSPHIEFPGQATSPNDWVNALLWIRVNTPPDAVFAVDSRYFHAIGVDLHGFRAVSDRAALADYFKDGGAVAMFPALAPDWKQMSNATYGLNSFSVPDFARLAHKYPVTWTIVRGTAPAGMDCPYRQRGYAVCKIPAA